MFLLFFFQISIARNKKFFSSSFVFSPTGREEKGGEGVYIYIYIYSTGMSGGGMTS